MPQVGDPPGKGLGFRLAHAPELDRKLPLPGPEQQRVTRGLGQILPRHIRIERQLLGELLDQGIVLHDQILSADAPGLDRALPHTLLRRGDDQLGGKAELAAEAVARGTGALAAGKRKMLRRQFVEHVAAGLAGERLAERNLAPRRLGVLLGQHDSPILALAERQLERIRQPTALVGGRHQPVDHDLDGELAPAAGRDDFRLVQILDLTIEAHALETPLAQPRQFVAQHAGLRPHERREQHHAFAGTSGENALHVVVERPLHDPAAVFRADLLADERPQQLGIVGDFRRGGDGAARTAGPGALLDREHGRQTVDEIDIGALQLVEHLPRLRRQALHVFPVALGVNRVEGQGRFARTARAGDDHELAARNAQLEVLQVVLTRAFDVDVGRSLHGTDPHRCAIARRVKARMGFSVRRVPALPARILAIFLLAPRVGAPFRCTAQTPCCQ